jgi:hypothetical protein
VKRKSALCSTGHGTGVTQEAPVRVQLARANVRRRLKRIRRVLKARGLEVEKQESEAEGVS